MANYALTQLARKLLTLAGSAPKDSRWASNETTTTVRDENTRMENLLAAGIAYSLPLPPDAVPSIDVFFGQAYGTKLTALVSEICEQRVLNPELIILAVKQAWSFRYAQTHDINVLLLNGLMKFNSIGGLSNTYEYALGEYQNDYSMLFTILSQIKSTVQPYFAEDSQDAE
ncbi:hypothetical protein PP187_gp113 [Klebsiella phage vB_KvM-Eowyn]|uniref:Uncharacterized protein n=1 Tax=Klebsiella phage vB_KvM-Eowyn TaxID=2762819 RepID=A0A7R8MJJ4_9CAUD|nr:hypothetical protein PP187_gp113 [Klebsiella phage vB_KvM-Eowyn]CAD5236102.1 hypothetical protein LLCLJKAH_00113 [Klebsiella phage vB_KvM-Eowyn]